MSLCLFLTNCNENVKNRSLTVENTTEISEKAVNINTASASDLKSLPKIGDELARRIIEHREKYGKFRRVENLILVHGLSDKKFRGLRNLVKVE